MEKKVYKLKMQSDVWKIYIRGQWSYIAFSHVWSLYMKISPFEGKVWKNHTHLLKPYVFAQCTVQWTSETMLYSFDKCIVLGIIKEISNKIIQNLLPMP